jgi:phosphoribosylformimino-5-aminoimidazole carboxamide ribotide isomerase
VLCTEISKDGTLSGPAIDLYKEMMDTYPQLHLIASGGVSSIDDIKALDAAGIPAVVFGKAIYEGRIDLNELIVEFCSGQIRTNTDESESPGKSETVRCNNK